MHSIYKALPKKIWLNYWHELKNGFVIHDLRRTFKTDARKAGISKSVRDSILGHTSSNNMDMYYDVVDDQDKLELLGF